jgi:hypothetical protein
MTGYELAGIFMAQNGLGTPPMWEKVCNYVFNKVYAYTQKPYKTDGTDAAVISAGNSLYAAGMTTPAILELVGNIALTYPFYRYSDSGEIMQGHPWGTA